MLKELHPPNITPLLMLYVNNLLPLEKCSVELLADYLALTTLPLKINDLDVVTNSAVFDEESVVATPCPRLTLIRWLMKLSAKDMSEFEPLVAAVMCSLIVKQSESLIKQELQLTSHSRESCYPFEKDFLRNSFVTDGENCKVQPSSISTPCSKISAPANFKFIVSQRTAERLADAIQMDYENIPGIKNSNGRGNAFLNYKYFISKVKLYLNILNLIEKYSIGEYGTSGQVGFRTVLERVFDNGMEKCNQYVMNRLHEDGVPGRSPETVELIMEYTRKVFGNRYLCDKMRTSLSQRLGLNVLEAVKRVFRSHLANHIRGKY